MRNKTILISIQPKWCQLIGNFLKTLEVRKNIPKLKPPFKCYIYCTKAYHLADRKFIASNKIKSYSEDVSGLWPCDGMVIGEFVCTGFKEINTKAPTYIADDILDESCLTADQIKDYANGADMLYGWVIKNVKLYSKPRELKEFRKIKTIQKSLWSMDDSCYENIYFDRAPQSWCYCYELSEE